MPDYNLKDWQAVERAERNVAQWLKERMGGEVRGHVVAALVLAPLSAVAAGAIVFGLGILGMGIGLYLFAFLIAAVAVLIAYPVQYFRWRRSLTRVTLHGGGVTIDEDEPRPVMLIRLSDSSDADWDVGDMLLFPATIAGMALQHVVAAWQLRNCDHVLMGKVLTALAHGGRRTSLYDLEMAIADARLPAVLQAMRHWPGVVWLVRDQVAVTVNDDLRNEIARQGGWRT